MINCPTQGRAIFCTADLIIIGGEKNLAGEIVDLELREVHLANFISEGFLQDCRVGRVLQIGESSPAHQVRP